METLVCPFSIWPGQGFYVELFLLTHSPLSSNQNGKGCFPDISSERHSACSAFAEFLILRGQKIFINFIGKGEAFHGIL